MRKLIHSVDSISTKADKYGDHGTSISNLIPEAIAAILRKLADE